MDEQFFVVFFFLMFLLLFDQRKRNCPDCGQPLFRHQSPRTKTWRQWFEGGFLSQDCGCETTLAGERVAPGTGPRTSSVIRGILLVTVIVGAVPVLLFFLLSQSAVAPQAALVATPPALVAAPPVVADPPIVLPGR